MDNKLPEGIRTQIAETEIPRAKAVGENISGRNPLERTPPKIEPVRTKLVNEILPNRPVTGETSGGKSSSKISQLLSDRPELTGTNREKLLSMVQDNKLATYINEVYRPGASVGDGGTADKLIMEFYEGNSRHLLKAKERLVVINKIIDSGKLNLNDLDIAEALRDDLEYAIDLFK